MTRSPTTAPVALLYPGDRAARDRSDPAESRFAAVFDALAAAGIPAAPAVYHDDFADEVEAQLRQAELVQVWCNPIEGGRRRDRLDAMLRAVADSGVVVSAHPDTILKLGTKDVLVASRDLPFGSDVHRVDSLQQLEAELPARLLRGARVLKQHRGHSGMGVWRVERDPASMRLRVRHAQRGCVEQLVEMAELLQRMSPYFEAGDGGHMIDQAWQPRIAEGMVRAYLVGDRVVGFGVQAVNALHPGLPGELPPEPGPRLYHGPELEAYQGLRRRLEDDWVGRLCGRVGLDRQHLPLLWDCDFMRGEEVPDGAERFVLCEINVSSVSPFPASAIAPLVEAIRSRLDGHGRRADKL